MKVLWIVNTIFPDVAKHLNIAPTVFGGWLISLMEELKNNKNITRLAIATTYVGNELIKIDKDNITYYLVPCKNTNKYDKKTEDYWKSLYQEFNPDLTHIHGTEYPHSLSFMNANKEASVCVSMQGLVSICGKKEIYNAGLNTKDMLSNITLRDIIKRDLFISQYKKMYKKSKYEKEVLRRSDIVIGRTTWDRINAYLITKEEKYEVCNENLRSSFYNKKWDINNIERHSIFYSQATYPLKGFHRVVEAIKLLKEKYADIKVFVAGPNITKCDTLKDKLKRTGYGKYLAKLINRYNLNNNIIFLGSLNEEEYCNYLLKSHLYLQSSSIENSSNSLGEAMLLGMPSVASFVGGTMDMIEDKKEGLLYPFNDISLMVNHIINIFENDKLAISLGNNANEHASITHNRVKNAENIIEIYKKLNQKK